MVRRACLSLTVGLLMATIGSAFAPAPVYREPPKPKVPEVYTSMQGIWELERFANRNALLNRRGIAIRRLLQQIHIKDGTWANVIDNNGTVTEGTKYQIVLDAKNSPATLDLKQTVANGFNRVAGADQVAMKGIVKVEGDTLTFCYVNGYQANAERPKQFIDGTRVIANGVITRTMILKRVK